MNNKIVGVVAFIAGSVVGAFAGKLYFEQKAEKKAAKSIAEVRAYYKQKEDYITYSQPEDDLAKEGVPEEELDKRAAVKARVKPEVINYAAMSKELGYQGEPIPVVSKNPAVAPEPPVNKYDAVLKPYVIEYDEYGRKDGQEISSLTYYICGTLAEDDDTVLTPSDIERIVTMKILNEYFTPEDEEASGHDNSIYVRNNKLHCDYEILRDYRSYFEVVGDIPEKRMG